MRPLLFLRALCGSRVVAPMTRLRHILRWTALITVATAVVAAVATWIYVERTRAALPTVTNLGDLRPDYGTSVRAQDGTYLGGEPTVEPLPFDELPPKLIATFLAAEDEDFFAHGGYNTRSILRAFFDNYRAGRTVQGASTISQQVAKHFLAPERTWRRKLQELLLAREIEERFSKREILDAYLGGVYFGEHAWGVTQASYTYFAVPPSELSTSQIATLAGLLPAPSVYNPIANPELAIRERNRVLRRMRDVGILNQAQLEELRAESLQGPTLSERPISPAPEAANTVRRTWDDIAGETPWEESDLEIVTTHHPGFQSLARESLERGIERYDRRRGYRGVAGRSADADAIDEALDASDVAGDITLARIDGIDDDGLQIRIPGQRSLIDADSLDWVYGVDPRTERSRQPGANWRDFFEIDDIIFARRVGDHWRLWQPPEHEGAFLLTDHHSGETLASVGSYDVDESQFNRAEQACRQPGSLFKTVLYAQAFSERITPATLLSDVPTDVTARDGVWQPRNADRDFRGYITALDAYAASRNIPAVNLIQHLGARPVIERARTMGVDSLLDPTPSLALGASCTRVSEMLDVHASIARGGLTHDRRHLAEVRDISSNTLRDHGHFLQRSPALIPRVVRAAAPPRPTERALSPAVNVLMTRAMRDVVTRGTAHELSNDWPVAAKTGTSDKYDTWFAAFDPTTTAVMWVGSDRNIDSFEPGEHSGTVTIPLFDDFYDGLAPDVDEWPPRPDESLQIEDVLIDPGTGLRARPGQQGIHYPFLSGTAPREYAPTEATRQLERFDSLLY